MDEKRALEAAEPAEHDSPPPPQSSPLRTPWFFLLLALTLFTAAYKMYEQQIIVCRWTHHRPHHKSLREHEQHIQAKQFSVQEQQLLASIPLEAATPLQPPFATTSDMKSTPPQPPFAILSDIKALAKPGPVDFEAHIMSQCPDAQYCIQKMVIPAMEEVAPLVNFTLSFIGTVGENQDDVECMHGPAECLGNMLMLCADHLYPDVPIISLGFANCLISDYKRISDRDFVEDCALQHAVDFEQLNACVSDDAVGTALLRKSVEWSKSQGVTYSCTVRVEGEKWCIRDGGEWKSCTEDSETSTLVKQIKTLAKGQEHAGK